VLVRHPLQPFDPRNFESGELVPAEAFSFDRSSYAGSLAMRAGQSPSPAFLDPPLPEVDGLELVNLERLIGFLEHPVRTFLQERLELRTAEEEDEPSDAIPVSPNKLEEWAVGNRLLRAGLAGLPVDGAQRVERLRGDLPPGQLGATVMQPIADKVAAVVERSAGLRTGEPTAVDVSIGLPSGLRLEGTVPRVYGNRIVRIEYSRLSPKYRIRAWVQLLAVCAAQPARSWDAVTVGRKKVGRREEVVGSFLKRQSPERAVELLDQLVSLYRLGLTCPLPMPPKTASAYAEKRLKGCNPSNAAVFAEQEWVVQAQQGSWGEFDDGNHRRVRFQAMSDLVSQPADPSEEYGDEPHRFGQLARTVWTPMLEAEEELT
jgi:exodeoxyribonuclease V gamma subunit